MNKKAIIFALAIFFIFFSFSYAFPNFLIPLELRLCDAFFAAARHFNKPPENLKEVVIVALDDFSCWKINKKLPLTRAFYAELLHKIYKGNPKLVFFDIVFIGDSLNPKDDEAFENIIKDKDNILFPYYFGQRSVNVRTKKAFTGKFGPSGYINKVIDPDGVLRRFYPFRLSIEDKIKDYTSELYLFDRYYSYDIKKNILLKNKYAYLENFPPYEQKIWKRNYFILNNDDTMLINYRAAINDLKMVAMSKVMMDDNFDVSIFKDKVVLIGATSEIFHDAYDTPLGTMPGTAIIANSALMFLEGEFICEAPAWFKWLIIFLLCVFTVLIYYRISIIKGFLFMFSVVAILASTAFILFLHNYYLNPFKLILICILGYISVNFYKYASVVIENMSLRKLSTLDELTGLFVFRYFKIVLSHEFEKCLRYKMPLSLLMIDIDNFKKINDTYGHQKGNIVLNKIGKIVLNSVRRSDFPARYGGEELSILLPHSNIEGAKKCAETIRSAIEKEEYFMTDSGPLKVTVSIGLSSFPVMNITSADDMIKFADAALYEAKRQGKNRVVVFNSQS